MWAKYTAVFVPHLMSIQALAIEHRCTWWRAYLWLCMALSPLWATAQTAPAPSDEYTDVQRLIRVKRYGEAMALAHKHLETKPRDAQMRFLLSVVQADIGERSQAIATLQGITADFPELAEPYNNLAVLQAAEGQLADARTSLEVAIRIDPAYAVAHENLGDVYLQLAQRAYARAGEWSALPSTQARLKMSGEWIAALLAAPANPPDPEPAPRLKILPSSMFNNNPAFINVPLRR
jgi:tetratricopeptide (TPR) repeat protein